jgi:hypothetical protein
VSCVLRAIGRDFDVDAFLSDSELTGATTFRRGEPRAGASAARSAREVGPASGFNLPVGHVELGDLQEQIREATAFLREQEEELRRLSQFPGLEEVCLDFGILSRDIAAQVVVFPAELLWQAGALDIDLVVTHYAVHES